MRQGRARQGVKTGSLPVALRLREPFEVKRRPIQEAIETVSTECLGEASTAKRTVGKHVDEQGAGYAGCGGVDNAGNNAQRAAQVL